jgi:hypothetical protein
MSGYRDLERQLRESVRRRATARAFSPRRWRSHRMALALAPLALVGGVATAATQLGHTGGSEEKARSLAFRAIVDTKGAPACSIVGHAVASVVDDPPRPEVTAVLPELATAPAHPVTPAALAFVRRRAGGAVLGRTVRLIAVGERRRLLVFVAYGQGPFTLADPLGCLRARRARLAELRPDAGDPVRRAADRVLAESRDTTPTAQTLTVLDVPPGRPAPAAGAGAGIPIVPGQALPTGILFQGSDLYAGIAKPGASSITLRPSRKNTRLAILRRVAVHHGLFAFSLPRHTGPLILTQRAADGRALGTQRVRE